MINSPGTKSLLLPPITALSFLFTTAGLVIVPEAGHSASNTYYTPPVELTAEQDHERIMDLLHIKSLRPGADGDRNSPHAANYDEVLANPYPELPNPLLLNDGEQVTSAALWWQKRRPEIVADFNRAVYGSIPQNVPRVRWKITDTTRTSENGIEVVNKQLVGHVDNSAYPLISVNIDVSLSIPAGAQGPVPVIIELVLSPEILSRLLERLSEDQRAAFRESGPTVKQQILARGWAYAALIPVSAQADNGAGLSKGVIGLTNHGRPRRLDDWGVLRAWAWSASRVLDYFETDNSINAKAAGIAGHSRYGKAALVAMAYDQRFAIGYISSSGEAGAKLFRRNFGEQEGNIAGTGEYHWMAGNFMKYAGPLTVADMPVDAHELIALCAPRPVFIGAGDKGDEWVDPKGMFMAAVAAGPVYRLLGKAGLGTDKFPSLETAVTDGDISFRQHRGGHTPGPNWPYFLQFAEHYLGIEEE